MRFFLLWSKSVCTILTSKATRDDSLGRTWSLSTFVPRCSEPVSEGTQAYWPTWPSALDNWPTHPWMDVIYLCSILENPECHVHHCAHQVIGICWMQQWMDRINTQSFFFFLHHFIYSKVIIVSETEQVKEPDDGLQQYLEKETPNAFR